MCQGRFGNGGLIVNPYVARKLFNEITNSEVAHLETGIDHAAFLAQRRHRYNGEARRVLDNIVALGDQAYVFVRYFLAEFDEEV